MLPFFTVLRAGPLAELQRALEVLVASHFPMQSDEFPRGSLQCNNYMDCIRKVNSNRFELVQGSSTFQGYLKDEKLFGVLLVRKD